MGRAARFTDRVSLQQTGPADCDHAMVSAHDMAKRRRPGERHQVSLRVFPPGKQRAAVGWLVGRVTLLYGGHAQIVEGIYEEETGKSMTGMLRKKLQTNRCKFIRKYALEKPQSQ